MHYLTLAQALAVHARLAPGQHLKPGGEHLLESALARPTTSYADHKLYPGVFDKAAALLEALVQNHPFTDGNKRTAYTCTILFLSLNGWDILPLEELEDNEQAQFVVQVAEHTLTFEKIAHQLEQWATPRIP
ncbi:type II toxin-antitoxin system death-on-curing family toxin [Rothia nasimurium]|uniref:Type II toxin-antitoxin system death-on-curing family toxin n=1 Tax=Rothia nasimurium TaxID=85336 RepID=A0A4Y9F5Z4_9MICC|nr:type II toxin-antitoxin system death-on-curing family toxin [Rothia nasimurium]MBF0808252.1 type II toxin-antitoxin system death-on-curing family toxin [Rothia nasimurium]TFU22319.1 type II toxin-antitoxin system death-on-curing family toxin [Rothia nasimurium]